MVSRFVSPPSRHNKLSWKYLSLIFINISFLKFKFFLFVSLLVINKKIGYVIICVALPCMFNVQAISSQTAAKVWLDQGRLVATEDLGPDRCRGTVQ